MPTRCLLILIVTLASISFDTPVSFGQKDIVLASLEKFGEQYRGLSFDYSYERRSGENIIATSSGIFAWDKDGRKSVENLLTYGPKDSPDWEKGCFFVGKKFIVNAGLSSDLGPDVGLSGFVSTNKTKTPWWLYLNEGHVLFTLNPFDSRDKSLPQILADLKFQDLKKGGNLHAYNFENEKLGKYTVTLDSTKQNRITTISIEKHQANFVFGLRNRLNKMYRGKRIWLNAVFDNFQFGESSNVCTGWRQQTVYETDGDPIVETTTVSITGIKKSPSLNENRIIFGLLKIPTGKKFSAKDAKEGDRYEWRENQVVKVLGGNRYETLNGEVFSGDQKPF